MKKKNLVQKFRTTWDESPIPAKLNLKRKEKENNSKQSTHFFISPRKFRDSIFPQKSHQFDFQIQLNLHFTTRSLFYYIDSLPISYQSVVFFTD